MDRSHRTLQVTNILEFTLNGMGATQGLWTQEGRALASE